jgi:Ca2+/Na+ antiporter
MENNSDKNKTNRLLLISNIILLILLIVFVILYYKETCRVDTYIIQTTQMTSQKDSLTREFNNLITDYDSLKTNNDTINAHLQAEQEKIKQLVEEVKTLKVANVTEIKKYKRELETLRKVMRHFVVQIDSLNTLNQNLTEENVKIKSDYKKSQHVNKELSQKNEELSGKVTIASVLKAKNFKINPLNNKGKPINKAKKVVKIETCFTIFENSVTPAGTKDVYIRIARPDKLVLNSSANNLFNYQGEQIVFSAKRQIEYQNKDIDMCIYWDNDGGQELTVGDYAVDVFIDGNMIGSGAFALK